MDVNLTGNARAKYCLSLPLAVFAALALAALVWIVVFVCHPNSEQSALFFCRAEKNFCYDFFTNRAVSGMQRPYVETVVCNMVDFSNVLRCDQCYPPLANYWVRLFPESFAGAMMCTFIGVVVFVLGFVAFIKRYAPRYCLISTSAICCSAPFFFAVSVANLVLYAVGFSLFFFAWHDSDSRLRKCLAAIALAIAAVLKVSPVLLGLLYLGRGWRSRIAYAFLSGVSAVLLFFVPFAFCGGIDAFWAWFENASMNSSAYYTLNGFGLYGLVVALVQSFTMRQPPLEVLQVLRICSSCLGLVVLVRGCLKNDGSWERGASVALGMLFIPPTMMYYTALFLVPFAIAGMFHSDKRVRKCSAAYFLFQCMLPRIPLFFGPPGSFNASFAAASSIDLAFVLLCVAFENRFDRLAGKE